MNIVVENREMKKFSYSTWDVGLHKTVVLCIAGTMLAHKLSSHELQEDDALVGTVVSFITVDDACT